MSQDNIEMIIEEIANCVEHILQKKGRVIVAIDGRCASGKTTLAGRLQKRLNGNLFHMDDFFLRPEQRTAQRLDTPGENVDHERFLLEVLEPLSRNHALSYRPFDCSTQELVEPIKIEPKQVSIVEGSYSCHNSLWKYFDLRIFMDVNPGVQIERIKIRNGEEAAKKFESMWIPLEEKYFSEFNISVRCDMSFEL